MVIITEGFPELQRHYDIMSGVYDEYASSSAAGTHFAQVMKKDGYKRSRNHVWLKPDFAAVIEPR